MEAAGTLWAWWGASRPLRHGVGCGLCQLWEFVPQCHSCTPWAWGTGLPCSWNPTPAVFTGTIRQTTLCPPVLYSHSLQPAVAILDFRTSFLLFSPKMIAGGLCKAHPDKNETKIAFNPTCSQKPRYLVEKKKSKSNWKNIFLLKSLSANLFACSKADKNSGCSVALKLAASLKFNFFSPSSIRDFDLECTQQRYNLSDSD